MFAPTPLFKLRITLPALAIALTALLSLPARAEIQPDRRIHELCMQADLIVSGDYEGGEKLRIGKVLYQEAGKDGKDGKENDNGGLKVGEVIEVATLANHTRHPHIWWREEDAEEEIQTRQILLFAKYGRDGRLEPISSRGRGSLGVIWHSDLVCYHYQPGHEPDFYHLEKLQFSRDKQQVSTAEVLEQVDSGLGQRELWGDILAIEPERRRIHAMASLYLKATPWITGLNSKDLSDRLEAFGPKAVEPIVEVLQERQPDDPAYGLISALYPIAVRAERNREVNHRQLLQPAVDPLIEWLKNPKEHRLPWVIHILKIAGDPRAMPSIRPFIGNEKENVRLLAAMAAVTMKDMESFDLIAEVIARPGQSQKSFAFMSNYLSQLDPERAKPIIEEAELKRKQARKAADPEAGANAEKLPLGPRLPR